MNYVLELENLTKLYAPKKGAKNISLKIAPGEIVGFIGPNGAGKSTTIEMVMGLVSPQSGTMKIFETEINSHKDRYPLLSRIGFLPAENGFSEKYNAEYYIDYAASISGKNNHKDKLVAYGKRLAKELDLDTKKIASKLSLGNKRKVGVVLALLHDPDLIILDEPTSGLDPLMQTIIGQLLKRKAAEGKTVFLSSHNLNEVKAICSRVIMIKESKIIFDDSTDEVISKLEKRVRVISPNKELVEKLNKLAEVRIVTNGNQVDAYVKHVEDVLKLLIASKHWEFYIESPSLEETFFDFYKSN